MDDRTESAGELRLVGPLTIRKAGDLHHTLQQELAGTNALTIDLPPDAEADLSFVQVVLSARVTARASGKTIQLKHPASGPLRDILGRGGFLAAAEGAFWTKGTLRQ